MRTPLFKILCSLTALLMLSAQCLAGQALSLCHSCQSLHLGQSCCSAPAPTAPEGSCCCCPEKAAATAKSCCAATQAAELAPGANWEASPCCAEIKVATSSALPALKPVLLQDAAPALLPASLPWERQEAIARIDRQAACDTGPPHRPPLRPHLLLSMLLI